MLALIRPWPQLAPVAAILIAARLSSTLCAAPSNLGSGSRTVLMADSEAILYHSALQQVLGKPRRLEGNPILW
ncbi:MAG: hypothetical protein ACO3PR_04345, partial [Limisphaerales bacterium]